MQVRVSRWGNSLAVRLPKELAERLALKAGQPVDMSIEDKVLTVRPVETRRYPTLAELVAEAKRLGPDHEPEVVGWGPDVGAEIIDDDYSRPSRRRQKTAK
jgi:antitoxin MazE